MSSISTIEQFKIWSKVAANSFGGPAGQIAVIHKLVVEERKIISEERFLHALNFCMLLPGPEAQQLATYMGWIINKWRGGLIAGGLFILPGFLSILILSYFYVIFNDTTLVQGLFYGMKPAIIAIVSSALYRISSKSLTSQYYWTIALLAFGALFFFNISFPIVVSISALSGIIHGKFAINKDNNTLDTISQKPILSETFKTILIWTVVWITPMIFTIFLFGAKSTFHTLNLFFSKMSMVTFGGAYAALSYVAQEAVNVYGWLQGSEMLDGLAMAETTPGPLIQVVQYVGFMGALRFSDLSNPYLSAFIGSILATWMTFAPCFLWIFSFAPYVEYIREKKLFSHALKSITACVVGVILNLSIWFMFQALFIQSTRFENTIFKIEYPVLSSIDFFAVAICVFAMILQFKFKKGIFTILITSTILGILFKFFN